MSEGQTRDALLEAPRHSQGPAPFLGQHNVEVIAQLLGYDNKRIEQLTQAGVLFAEERVKTLRRQGVI